LLAWAQSLGLAWAQSLGLAWAASQEATFGLAFTCSDARSGLGLGVALSLRAPAHPLHTTLARISGASIPEPTMRPNPTQSPCRGARGSGTGDSLWSLARALAWPPCVIGTGIDGPSDDCRVHHARAGRCGDCTSDSCIPRASPRPRVSLSLSLLMHCIPFPFSCIASPRPPIEGGIPARRAGAGPDRGHQDGELREVRRVQPGRGRVSH
jgi:hypothetical protein